MTNFTKHFVSNQNIPEFIKTDHELYDTFIKAYYEWLELENDSENNNYLDFYKSVGHPGYMVPNQEKLVDIDATLDKFIEFFANEVVPIALDGIQTNPRFFLKHIRDLYLAKGTIQSFKLFFKLYYNDNIDVFETRDNVLRTSDGKYYAFPTAHFYVTDFEDQVSEIDFTLATIRNDSDVIIDTILDGTLVGKTRDAESIIKAQFTNNVTLETNTPYFIVSADGLYKLKVQALVSLSEISMVASAPLYDENDPIFVDSLALDRRFYGSVTSVLNGNVNGIKTRDKGVFYNVNDYFTFENDENTRGRFTVTKVGNYGEILEINNIPLRTGSTNNGWIANNLEDVYIPISNGGYNWKQLPVIKYHQAGTRAPGSQPYPELSTLGIGFQSIPISSTIGLAQNISINQETFFKDSDDVVINPPANIIIENNTLRVGDKVSFQTFGNLANWGPLTDDSEKFVITYKIQELFDSVSNSYVYLDSEIYRKDNVTFIYGFDSDTFLWKTKNVEIDTRAETPEKLFAPVIELLDSESNVNYSVYQYGGETDKIDGGPLQTTFDYYITHQYNINDSEIHQDQNVVLYIRRDEEKNEWETHSAIIRTINDSELFTPLINYVTSNHDGNFNVSQSLYVDNVFDGGEPFSAIADSDYDGGITFDSEGNFLPQGFDSFDVVRAAVSHLRIEYEIEGYDSEYDGGFDSVFNITATNEIDGGNFFGFTGAKVNILEVTFEDNLVNSLEDYHFDLDYLVGMDSEVVSFSHESKKGNLRLATTDSDMGEWVDMGYFGEIIGISHNNQVVKVITYDGSELPTQDLLDSWSAPKYSVVKLSPLNNDGISKKDYSLPLTNIVHQIDRMDISYKTSVVSDLHRKFYNEDGFISSDVMNLRDNYYYSDHSYRIKTKLPLENWKRKFKTMLHPAGMVLTSDYVQNLETGTQLDTKPDTTWNILPGMTFDMNQEYIDVKDAYSTNADNIYYKSNAFESINTLTERARQLDGSSQTSIPNLAFKQQSGNAFWDYEPIGWVRTAPITVNGDKLFGMDSETFFTNRFSTQDSDGNGVVKEVYNYYQNFNETSQDFYKNASRLPKTEVQKLMISKVQFEDAGFVTYNSYDSDLPEDFMLTFVDSDKQFNKIDYNRLLSDSDNRYFPDYVIPRAAEIAIRKEKDLRIAMKENNELVWDDSDKIYYDYEAYERKWNQINNRRTRNTQGYTIKGYIPITMNEHIVKRSKQRNKDYVDADHRTFSFRNAPYHNLMWNTDSLQINTHIVDHRWKDSETFFDPRVSMRGRRGI